VPGVKKHKRKEKAKTKLIQWKQKTKKNASKNDRGYSLRNDDWANTREWWIMSVPLYAHLYWPYVYVRLHKHI